MNFHKKAFDPISVRLCFLHAYQCHKKTD
jgi:hypothetical protein